MPSLIVALIGSTTYQQPRRRLWGGSWGGFLEHDPMRLGRLAATVADQRPLGGQGNVIRHRDVRLVPLEDERSVRRQDPEALSEPTLDVIAPVQPEFAVLERQPALTAVAHEVRRIEHDQGETLGREWQVPEVGNHVGLDNQRATAPCTGGIGQLVRLMAAVDEDGTGVRAVEPEHAGSTAGIQYGRIA